MSAEEISELITAIYRIISPFIVSGLLRHLNQLSPVKFLQDLIGLIFIGQQIFFFSLIKVPRIVQLIHIRDICFLLVMLLMKQIEEKHLFCDEPIAPVVIESDVKSFVLAEAVGHAIGSNNAVNIIHDFSSIYFRP